MKIVTAAIIRKDNKFLLARRAQGQVLEGYWEFPGGKKEMHETLTECLERELMEEFSIKSKAKEVFMDSIYKYENGIFKIIAIFTELLTNNFKLTVHDEIEWIAIESMLEYKLAPADIPIAQKLMERENG